MNPVKPLLAARQTKAIRLPKTALLFALLGGGLAALFMLSLALGSVRIPLEDIARVLLGGEASKETWTHIILKIRLPKALTAASAGAALSLAGLLMQTLFRNPLADPFVLGISSGASLGVALVVLSLGTAGGALLAGLGLAGDLLMTAAAGLGAASAMTLAMSIARRGLPNTTLLILGLMFGYLTTAVVTLLLYFSIPERIQVFINWSMGTFGGVTWGQMPLFLGILAAGAAAALLLAKPLNALLLGDLYARSMGLNVPRTRLWVMAATAALAGTVTAFCGPVGFIGIAAPHLCRGLFRTSDHRLLLPAALLLGAGLALLAALLAELPGSNLILPLNAITALLGAPVVMAVLLKR